MQNRNLAVSRPDIYLCIPTQTQPCRSAEPVIYHFFHLNRKQRFLKTQTVIIFPYRLFPNAQNRPKIGILISLWKPRGKKHLAAIVNKIAKLCQINIFSNGVITEYHQLFDIERIIYLCAASHTKVQILKDLSDILIDILIYHFRVIPIYANRWYMCFLYWHSLHRIFCHGSVITDMCIFYLNISGSFLVDTV